MKVLTRVLFAFAYTAGQITNFIGMLGGGHGTLVFLIPLFTWFLPLTCLALLSWFKHQHVRVAFVMMMLLHYLVTAYLIFLIETPDRFEHTIRTFNAAPISMVFAIAWYLAGQVILWLAFFMERRKFYPAIC